MRETGGIRRNSYGAPRLLECGCSPAREPAPAPRADHCRSLYSNAHTLSAPRRLRCRSDLERREVGPGRCAAHCSLRLLQAAPPVPTRRANPQTTSAASGLRGAYLYAASHSSLLAPHSGPAVCRASAIEVVTAPRTARFLLSPPSHLPSNLLPTPRPPPCRPIRRGRPLRLSSRPRPSPARPVRPQCRAGGWAATTRRRRLKRRGALLYS